MYNPYYHAYAAGTPGGFSITSPSTLLMLGGAGLTIMSVVLDFMFKGSSTTHALMFFGGLGAAAAGGYLTFAGGFPELGLPAITNKVINPVDVAQGGLDSIWKWLQGYSPYLLGGGVIMWLISRKATGGWLGASLHLGSWLMMLVGGGMLISNFGGITSLPNAGATIRKTINPNANYTYAYNARPRVSNAYYTGEQPDIVLPRTIVTGKSVLGSRNPIDDSNHVYSNISDVY